MSETSLSVVSGVARSRHATARSSQLPSVDEIDETARFLHAIGIVQTPVHRIRVPVRMDPHTTRIVDLWLKDETRQVTGSYKVRGATAAVRYAVEQQAARTVVTASTGNFAAGVAWACRHFGIDGIAVVPTCTVASKLRRIEATGLQVRVAGATFDDAAAVVKRLADEQDDVVALHPFDHPATVAGQGSISVELLQQLPAPDTLIVQLGGGGLFAGNAVVHAARRPATKLAGATCDHAPAFFESVLARSRLPVPLQGQSLCDGVAVAEPGQLGWTSLSELAHHVVSVTEEEVVAAMAWLDRTLNVRAEGAGAIGVAAVLAGRVPGNRIAVIISGGNRCTD